MGRAAARAFIGSFLWVAFQYFWVITSVEGLIDDPVRLDFATTVFSQLAVTIAIVATIAVVTLEKLVPAARIPNGNAYRSVAGNRWVAAGLMGALVSVTIGLVVETGYFGTARSFGVDAIVCAALGFIAAEALVGHRFAGNCQERPRTA